MNFQRGKINGTIVGPRWCVEHYLDRNPPPANGWFDIVGGADESEARASVEAAYGTPRVFVSARRLD